MLDIPTIPHYIVATSSDQNEQKNVHVMAYSLDEVITTKYLHSHYVQHFVNTTNEKIFNEVQHCSPKVTYAIP